MSEQYPPMKCTEFLNTLYQGAASGYITGWTLPDKKTAYFPVSDIAAASKYAESRFDTHDVYYGVGLRRERLGEHQRGGNDDVSVLTAFWADIDILGPAHSEQALPPTKEDALEFLEKLPLRPSMVVSSGNGLHVYWLLTEPVDIADADRRKFAAATLRGWQTHINAAAQKAGWKLDNTSDLSRVLRLPGGINHKKGCTKERVAIIAKNDARYSVSDFTVYIPTKSSEANVRVDMGGDVPFTGTTGSGERILEKCAFLRYCRDNAAKLPEPHWYAMLSNLSLCSDGVELCHAFSKSYPGYSVSETEGKISHAVTAKKPHTCEYIRDALGFDCGKCEAEGKAPVALAVITKAETVRALLEAEITDYNAIFGAEYLDALCFAKNLLPADYKVFKNRVKRAISSTDLDKRVKAHMKTFASRKTESDDETPLDALSLEGIDLGGAVVPSKWIVSSEGGICRLHYEKAPEKICPSPVVISRRLSNIEDGKERLELAFIRDGRWKTLIGGRTHIYNKASIIGLADDGLHVTSGSAAALVNYLSDYEAVNKEAIPLFSSIARLGWIDETQFFPYSMNRQIVFEEDSGTLSLYRNLAAQGDYDVWKKMMRKLRENPVARFITSASFASPLLCKIDIRTFVIHLWHMSASGKSAALKAAISVWGNPLRIMGSGFTTLVGMEQMAGTLRHLPFGIDEKQANDDKKLNLQKLIYILGQGTGKIRGAKNGGNTEIALWHNIVMLTGEEPITQNSSMDGVQTRVFELYGKPVDDIEFAKEVHAISENHYGFAGAEFMRRICGMIHGERDYLTREYKALSGELRDRGLQNVQADYIAAVALGDMLAEIIIFGTENNKARNDALDCGVAVYAINYEQKSADSIERAWDFVTGWLVSNEHRFLPDASPIYGKMKPRSGGHYDEYFVIPQYLDDALEIAGFNVKKTLQGFRERGYVNKQIDSEGKERTKTVGRVNDKSIRGYLFRLKSQGIPPLGCEDDEQKPLDA